MYLICAKIFKGKFDKNIKFMDIPNVTNDNHLNTVNQQTFAATIFSVFLNLEIFAAINFRAFVSVTKSAKT